MENRRVVLHILVRSVGIIDYDSRVVDVLMIIVLLVVGLPSSHCSISRSFFDN